MNEKSKQIPESMRRMSFKNAIEITIFEDGTDEVDVLHLSEAELCWRQFLLKLQQFWALNLEFKGDSHYFSSASTTGTKLDRARGHLKNYSIRKRIEDKRKLFIESKIEQNRTIFRDYKLNPALFNDLTEFPLYPTAASFKQFEGLHLLTN